MNYDIMVSELAKGGLESGVWIDEYNNQNKEKNNITKSMSLLFLCAVYHSKTHVIPHSVIAAILDVIFNISKRRKTTTICQSNSPNKTTVGNYQK